MTKTMRPYQEEATSRTINGVKQGLETGINHIFTGGGKTVISIEVNRKLAPPQKGRSIMIAPAKSLIFQMAQNYRQQWPELQAGVAVNNTMVPGLGVVMGTFNQPSARIIVGSAQTLVDKKIEDYQPIEKSDIVVDRFGNIRKSPDTKRRVLVSERFDEILANGGLPTLMQSDECHHSVADGTLAMFMRIQQLQRVMQVDPIAIVGYTATPIRNDGRGLFNLFKTIYISRSYKWGQKNGYLVPFADPIRVVIDEGQDIRYTENWIDIILKTYRERALDRHIMGFIGKMGDLGPVEASETITRAFIDAGFPASHEDGQKCIFPDGSIRPLSKRGDLHEMYKAGKYKVRWAFAVGLEGLDLPIANGLFWVRATDNDVLKTQAVGRILRLHEGKTDALLVEFTGRDFTVNPLGSLFGFKVDPLTQKYEPEESEEEADEVLDGVNIKDIRNKGEVIGLNTTYKIADIISKQSTDWYRDEDTDHLSVYLNDNHSLIIAPPQYTKADYCQMAANDIANVLNQEPNPYQDTQSFRRYGKFEAMAQKDLLEWETLLQWAYSVYSNFTMWSIVRDQKRLQVKGKSFVLANSSLDMLLLDSVEYMANVGDVEEKFAGRKKQWKTRDKATAAQRAKLKELGHVDDDPDLRKGEASSLINYLTIRPVFAGYMNVIETFLKGNHIL